MLNFLLMRSAFCLGVTLGWGGERNAELQGKRVGTVPESSNGTFGVIKEQSGLLVIHYSRAAHCLETYVSLKQTERQL